MPRIQLVHDEIHTVTVDASSHVEQIIADGDYNWRNQVISQGNLWMPDHQSGEIKLRDICFGCLMTEKEIVEMVRDEMRCGMATPRQFLSLMASNKQLGYEVPYAILYSFGGAYQSKFITVTRWVSERGRREGSGRELVLEDMPISAYEHTHLVLRPL